MEGNNFDKRIFLNMLRHIDSIVETSICKDYLLSLLSNIKTTNSLSGMVKVPLPTKLPMESLDVCNYSFRRMGLNMTNADYREGKNIEPKGDIRMRLVKVEYKIN
ncbi:Hypothetical protein ORPV_218 [Orpheovirus IHUMI-LCC2]|uniref:Uncharacterized protein n=1 Tax=Orpheovirus IHUMI-LCC2 TaxID=2023057 RepID=A0A2I2L3K9_9VIRU|nr:Hypothetical protein ORPV_218 [Orpheovirus IHUMI-LCC2]SNW62122.1 Hypothetical protein ORPV_218 [Orpheovirus IHUMI-LCC2]